MNAPIPLGHVRMWRNLSLEQVARLTGATVADILAVELGDGTHFSPGTDVAALLRAYANAVGLDPEAVVRNHLPSLSSDRGHSDHALHPVASNHREAQSSTNGRTSDVFIQFRSERSLEPTSSTPAGAERDAERQLTRQRNTSDNDRARRLSVAAAIAAIISLSISLPLQKTSPNVLSGNAKKGEAAAGPRSQPTMESKASRTGSPVASENDAKASGLEQQSDPIEELDGWWDMTNRVESSSYAAYRRLRLRYRLQLQQDGSRVTGQGQKWSENGRRIPGSTRTPISVDGVIEGRRVALTFVERGHRRDSGGTFELMLTSTGQLTGTFESDAAKSRGSSIASKLSAMSSAQ